MAENYYLNGRFKFSPKADKQIKEAIEKMFPTDILDALDRKRPYNGQSWTDEGLRGMTEVKDITMRDIRDCFIRACYQSSPNLKSVPKSIYDLDWEHIDPMALCQNMSCWIERYMGIYPNVPKQTQKEIRSEIPIIDLEKLFKDDK